MSFSQAPGPDYVTTTQAGQITGRSQDAVRSAINMGVLPGVRHDGRQYVLRDELLAWNRRSRRLTRRNCVPAFERTAQLLAEYHSATVAELAELRQLHPGNIRKHLAILAKHGRAEQRADGEWVLTHQTSVGAA